MENHDFISAAIVTYNNGKLAADICNELLSLTKKYPLKLYVIDNNSTDKTVELLNHISGLEIIKNTQNIGFGKGHNLCLNNVGKYHFVINPDISVNCDILSEITDFMEANTDIAMLNPKILNPDGTEQKLPKERPTFKSLFLGRILPAIRKSYTHSDVEIRDVTDVNFCSGCFFCIRGDVFQSLKGFDERFFLYLEDADLTLRAKLFGRTVMAPQFAVTHRWQRGSAKNIRLLIIHISSCLKFLFKWRNHK